MAKVIEWNRAAPRAVSRLSWRCSGQLQICQLIGFLHPAVFTGELVTTR
jgi:hypothetical protein